MNLELPQLGACVGTDPLELVVLAFAVLVVGARLETARLQKRVDPRVVLGAVQVDARERLSRRGQWLVVLGIGGKPARGVGRGLHARVVGVLVGRSLARNLDVRREVLLAGADKDVGLATGHGRDNPVLVHLGHRVIRRHVRHLAQDARNAQLGRLAGVKRELRGRQHGRLLREDRQVVLVCKINNRLVVGRGVDNADAVEAVRAASTRNRAVDALVLDRGHAVGDAHLAAATHLAQGVGANGGNAVRDGRDVIVDGIGEGQDQLGAAIRQDHAVGHGKRTALDQADVVQAVGKGEGRRIQAGKAGRQLEALEAAGVLEHPRADRLQALVQGHTSQRAAVRKGFIANALDACRHVDRRDAGAFEGLGGQLAQVLREGHRICQAPGKGVAAQLGHGVAQDDLLQLGRAGKGVGPHLGDLVRRREGPARARIAHGHAQKLAAVLAIDHAVHALVRGARGVDLHGLDALGRGRKGAVL